MVVAHVDELSYEFVVGSGAIQERGCCCLDVAVDHVAHDGRLADQDTPTLPAGNTRVDDGFEAKPFRHDTASSRRDSARSDEASVQHEYNNEKLVDELFAKRK